MYIQDILYTQLLLKYYNYKRLFAQTNFILNVIYIYDFARL